MKTFLVFKKTYSETGSIEPEFVEEGFSFYAAIFNIFYALYKGSYYNLAFMVIISIAFQWLSSIVAPEYHIVVLLEILKMFIFGLFYHEIEILALKRKGYVLSDIIVSDSLINAKFKYFERVVQNI